MGRRNRETLRNFFRRGALPTEESFFDLIDSTLNLNDEGFNKSERNGLEIQSQALRPSLLSFFRAGDPADPVWRLALDEVDRRRLQFWDEDPGLAPLPGAPPPEPTLTLGPGPRVGVNTDHPERTLDVNGTLRTMAREGVIPRRAPGADGKLPPPVLANGDWHVIAGPFDGCHALEVVVGVGLKRTGRYGLLHAIAINTYNPTGFFFDFFRRKRPIRVTQGYYRYRSDRLALRWARAKEGKGYVLEVRSLRDYGSTPTGEPIRIGYHVTELWADSDMSGSWNPMAQG
jgi:hypothetical protein